MSSPSRLASLTRFLESDTGFYYAVGLFTIAIFVLALVFLALFTPGGISTRGLVGLVVGFLLFMLVYFVSMAVHRLEDADS